MNKKTYIFLFTTIFLYSLFLVQLFPDTTIGNDEKNVLETVDVTDFEVPVRVFLKKKLVDNLKKEDFLLYEGGKLQKINGFYITRKKIDVKADISAEEKPAEVKGRYFVLVFKITEFNDQLNKGLDYLFDNLFRKNDQLLIFVNEKTFFINNLNNLSSIREVVSKMLNDEIKHSSRISR